ncbi:hypothetical protein AVEN_58898-1 [Araneus ventricosus]|uniref:Uncharacterized protein n=1 Tax=Araneus ventricosus TaxID=182803 RepID=A0A4Y2JM75_ARAVE|nr:hypothetical protein AVEN_58898-1 [Araneus ventricosus]
MLHMTGNRPNKIEHIQNFLSNLAILKLRTEASPLCPDANEAALNRTEHGHAPCGDYGSTETGMFPEGEHTNKHIIQNLLSDYGILNARTEHHCPCIRCHYGN